MIPFMIIKDGLKENSFGSTLTGLRWLLVAVPNPEEEYKLNSLVESPISRATYLDDIL